MRRIKEDRQLNMGLFIQAEFNGDYKKALNSFLGYIGKTHGEQETEDMTIDWYNRIHDGKHYFWENN